MDRIRQARTNINIALLWLSNQISTKTAIDRLHKLSTITIVNKANAESVKNKHLQLVEAIKIILDFYNDIPAEIQTKKDLYQYLIEHEIKTVNVKVNNREEKVSAAKVIITLDNDSIFIDSNTIHFEDIERIRYRNKIIYQK